MLVPLEKPNRGVRFATPVNYNLYLLTFESALNQMKNKKFDQQTINAKLEEANTYAANGNKQKFKECLSHIADIIEGYGKYYTGWAETLKKEIVNKIK